MAGEQPKRTSPKRASRSSSRSPRPVPPATTGLGSDDSREPTASSSASSSNALGLEQDTWTPPEQPAPADATVDDAYVPPSAEPIEWTPERCAFLVRGAGLVLHTADGLSREPEGAELWRATEDDIGMIAPPLSRIMNRYEPARRLAGVSDEAELAIGVLAYTRRQLVARGQVATAKRQRDELAAEEAGPETTFG
jgi:hypothetical protein